MVPRWPRARAGMSMLQCTPTRQLHVHAHRLLLGLEPAAQHACENPALLPAASLLSICLWMDSCCRKWLGDTWQRHEMKLKKS